MKTKLEKLEKHQYFFDAHMHVFNLSHAGLLAFINRFLISNKLSFKIILDGKALRKHLFSELWEFITSKKFYRWLWKGIKNLFREQNNKKKSITAPVVNTLSVLENDIARQFRFIEFDYLMFNHDSDFQAVVSQIRNTRHDEKSNIRKEMTELKESWNKAKDKNIRINDTDYKRIIITPLMMDFGVKSYQGLPPEKIHYHLPPRKQIKEQAIDLFNGIHEYYRTSFFRLFEIYPFLAINTGNFDLDETSADQKRYNMTLDKILDKYFVDFSKNDLPEARHDLLLKKLNQYTGSRYSTEPVFKDPESKSDTRYYYAGIKVYPPLGFDPWPEDSTGLKKAKRLYDYCADKNIPITTHCSDGGFVAVENHKVFVSPGKWQKVLEYRNELKLNFAHDGIHNPNIVDNEWTYLIIDLIIKYPNVYFDFSYNGYDEKYYQNLSRFLLKLQQKLSSPELEKISNRIMFGTDFMVNLFDVDSYYQYINLFSETKVFEGTPFSKGKFCQDNPYRFIFGEETVVKSDND